MLIVDVANVLQATVLQKEIVLNGQWSNLAQIADACELPRNEVSEAALKGALWHQRAGKKPGKKTKLRRIRNADTDAASGDTVYLNYDRKVLDQLPATPVLVSDQGNYSIWFKPPGTLSQGSKWSDHCTITQTASGVHGKKCLLVHRLDRAACGLMVLAHTANACKALAALFEARKVRKIYRATVHGQLKPDMPWEISTPVDNKPAQTVVLSSDYSDAELQSQLKVDIKTGRKHQIRSHLASEGFPVVGDRLFDPDRKHDVDLQLAAIELQFNCPFSGKLIEVELDDSLLSLVSGKS